MRLLWMKQKPVCLCLGDYHRCWVCFPRWRQTMNECEVCAYMQDGDCDDVDEDHVRMRTLVNAFAGCWSSVHDRHWYLALPKINVIPLKLLSSHISVDVTRCCIHTNDDNNTDNYNYSFNIYSNAAFHLYLCVVNSKFPVGMFKWNTLLSQSSDSESLRNHDTSIFKMQYGCSAHQQ